MDLTQIIDKICVVGFFVLGSLFLGVAVVVIILFGWIVCLFFVLTYLPALLTASNQCKKTNHSKRFPHSRLEAQDYRHFLGIQNPNPETQEDYIKNELHAKIGKFPSGKPSRCLKTEQQLFLSEINALCYAFSEEDQGWLQKEYLFQLANEAWKSQWNFYRASLKGCVPILGMLWILGTETGLGGGSSIGCTVCALGGSGAHWKLSTALQYHLQQLKKPKEQRGKYEYQD